MRGLTPRTIAIGLIVVAIAGAGEARPARSAAAKAEFQRMNPCPVNGKSRGPCPGWEIDHAQPLKCGGADAAVNMQWLTIAEHKAKTASEAGLCRTK